MSADKRPARRRADLLLVERGFAADIKEAQALLMAGEISVSGRIISQPGTLLATDSLIEKAEPSPFVSRGGIKLACAIDQFHLNLSGLVAADIGSSTGGFTDCLLQHGVKTVYAVDVGKGQLDWKLRRDARVVVMEGINARHPLRLPQEVDLATIDVSFISVEKIIPSISSNVAQSGIIIVLVKPQFEARKEEVGRGGVIREPEIHARVLGRFLVWAIDQGFRLGGLVPSPITGASGNHEFLVLLRKGPGETASAASIKTNVS
jgi:23S rRNA (cytidine1920-2'-O)/16S rRNA (cytidine1409-2'-O)-methyltransferase